MSRQERIQYIGRIAETRAFQTLDRLMQIDQAARRGEIEDAERSGDGKPPAAGKADAVTIVDKQKIRSDPER
jgi:hypothetical protein